MSLLAKLTEAAAPVDVDPMTGFQAPLSIDELTLVDVPKKYTIPSFTPKYSGTTDPDEHVAQYKQLMWTTSSTSIPGSLYVQKFWLDVYRCCFTMVDKP